MPVKPIAGLFETPELLRDIYFASMAASFGCREESYTCGNCGRAYAYYQPGYRQGFCSNRCRDTWIAVKKAEDPGFGIKDRIARRSARRAATRANRHCEHCHAPLDASRSTMRFCSTRCRVAHHRSTKGE
jgi:endogenous inhibitor of DNA gyrase (YacG/DUF329 family)